MLPREAKGSTQQSYVVWRKYKTSRYLGQVTVALPPELVQEILDHVDSRPADTQTWVFNSLHGDHALPVSKSSFSRWACQNLQKATGNPYITLTTLRDVVSSHLQSRYYLDRPGLDEPTKALYKQKLVALARCQMHSVATMLCYRLTLSKSSGLPETVDPKKVLEKPKTTASPRLL